MALQDSRLREAVADLLSSAQIEALVRRKQELVLLPDQLTDHGRRVEVFDSP
jgi:hypothetical protein